MFGFYETFSVSLLNENEKMTEEATLKYSIRDRLQALDRKERSQMKKILCEELGISRVHLNRILAYEKAATNEALPSQLQAIAGHLKCTVDDLLN